MKIRTWCNLTIGIVALLFLIMIVGTYMNAQYGLCEDLKDNGHITKMGFINCYTKSSTGDWIYSWDIEGLLKDGKKNQVD